MASLVAPRNVILIGVAIGWTALTTIFFLAFKLVMVFTAVLGASGRSRASDGALATAVGITFGLWIVVRVGWAFAFGR